MSTETSAAYEWEDLDYDAKGYDKGYAKKTGHIAWSHTSDTVAWAVNGKAAYIITPEEFSALRKACAEWGES